MKEIFIILPGWTQTEKSYKRLIEVAPENYQVIVAHHHEIIPNAKITDFVANFKDFIKAKHLTQINLVGHSLGGALAFEFSLRHPEMVQKLFLIDSAGIYGGETLPKLLHNWLRNFFHRGRIKSLNAIRNSIAFVKRIKMHLKLAHYAYKVDLREQGQKIKPPVTILWGEKDVLTPLWQGELLHKTIPGSKLVVLKDMDHDWILHSPKAFWENI